MTFQIRRIGIYNVRGELRSVELKLGAMNIVTGSSKRGKSSLGKIIDYCLGSERFRVPGVIRETVVAYALILDRGGEQLLVARLAPAVGASTTTTMHVRAGDFEDGFPPLSSLVSNADLDTAVALISRFASIQPNITDPGAGSRAAFDATIRHAMYFVMQWQNEIANQDLLFHGQGLDDFRPMAIRDVAPYFFGATDPDHSSRIEALRRLRQEASQLRRTLAEQSALTGPSGQVLGLVTEALDVGLLAQDDVPTLPSQREMVELLGRAASGSLDAAPMFREDDSIGELRVQADRLAEQFTEVKSRIRHLTTLQAETDAFTGEASEQLARLQSVEIFSPTEDVLDECPVCSADLTGRIPELAGLERTRQEILDESAKVAGTAPRIDAALTSARDELSELNLALATNRQALRDLESARANFDQLQDALSQRALVRGRISLYLDTVERTAVDASAEHRLGVVQDAVDQLESELDASNTRERLESALSVISANIGEIASGLDLEHSETPLRLNMRLLTLVADTDRGPVTLAEMGAGENYVGYHVATYLAMHRFFVARDRPVPRFLFLDQPSQVYFPPDPQDEPSPRSPVVKDPDREGLRRLLQQVAADVAAADGDLQVIITDHADLQEPWFQDLVEHRWRRGEEALVPIDWLE